MFCALCSKNIIRNFCLPFCLKIYTRTLIKLSLRLAPVGEVFSQFITSMHETILSPSFTPQCILKALSLVWRHYQTDPDKFLKQKHFKLIPHRLKSLHKLNICPDSSSQIKRKNCSLEKATETFYCVIVVSAGAKNYFCHGKFKSDEIYFIPFFSWVGKSGKIFRGLSKLFIQLCPIIT